MKFDSHIIQRWLREKRFSRIRKTLRDKDVTLIANNCVAGCVLHDFGKRFDTPTVNLYIPFPDYIIFLKHIQKYAYAEIKDITNGESHPVGLLGGVIKLHFLHYKTFNEGVSAWKRRMERVHWDNMYVVLVERDGCSYQDLKDFEKLPFEHKVALTKRMYPKMKNTFFMEDYVNCSEVGDIMRFNNLFGKRGYDVFNWIHFLGLN